MPYAVDPTNRILLWYGPNGEVRWYDPKNPSGSTLTSPPSNLVALITAYANGNDQALDLLGTAAANHNQTEASGAAATAPGRTAAVLPEPADITAQANVARTTLSGADRLAQIQQRETNLRQRWAQAGLLTPFPTPGGSGANGGFGGTGDSTGAGPGGLSLAPMTLNGVNLPPEYVNAFNQVNEVALAGEADRRARALDAIEGQMAGAVDTKNRLEKNQEVYQNLHDLQAAFDQAEAQANADPSQDRHLVAGPDGRWYHSKNAGLYNTLRQAERTRSQWQEIINPVEAQAERAKKLYDSNPQAYQTAAWDDDPHLPDYLRGPQWQKDKAKAVPDYLRGPQWQKDKAKAGTFAQGGAVLPPAPRFAGGGAQDGSFSGAAGLGSPVGGSAAVGAPAQAVGVGLPQGFAGAQAEQFDPDIQALTQQLEQIQASATQTLQQIAADKQSRLVTLAQDHAAVMAGVEQQATALRQQAAARRQALDQEMTVLQARGQLRPVAATGATAYAG